MSDEAFSLGFEGEQFDDRLKMLLIPAKIRGEYIGVYRRANDNGGRYSVVWGSNLKWFDPDATLELIAYIHKLRGYL